MPPRIPYKIILTPAQKQALKSIGTNRVLFFDDTSKVMVDKTYATIDLLVFNSLEMIGILGFDRKIGKDTCLYKINNNYIQKVKNG